MSDSCKPKPVSSGNGGTATKGTKTACKIHARLRIQEVKFSSNHVVEKDTLGNFSSPEWKHGRSTTDNSPICYTRDTQIKLTAKFKVTRKPCSVDSVTIEGKARIGKNNILFKGKINVKPADTEVSVSLSGSSKLPNRVDCVDLFKIGWAYNPASTGSLIAGTSANILYVVLADPVGTPAYWTLLDISCRAASKQTTEGKVVSKSYKPFSGRALTRKRDNKGLTYWNPKTTTCTNTQQLLASADGSGQCGSWSEFLIDMFKCHGINSASKVLVVHTLAAHAVSSSGFLVKNWRFTGAGSKPAPWPYVMHVDCVSVAGVAGQRNPNPPPAFFNHFVVKYGGEFYDPSYGSSPVANQLKWENASIDGLFKKTAPKNLVGYKKTDHSKVEILYFKVL
jgi:hypothetical protein